jgi:hypothetical protein
MTKAKKIRITDSNGMPRQIGWIHNNAFISFRRETTHMYRNGLGYSQACKLNERYWAIDAAAAEWMRNNGIEKVVIIGRKGIYKAPLNHFFTHVLSKDVIHPPHRKQVILHFDAFRIEDLDTLDKEELRRAEISFKVL